MTESVINQIKTTLQTIINSKELGDFLGKQSIPDPEKLITPSTIKNVQEFQNSLEDVKAIEEFTEPEIIDRLRTFDQNNKTNLSGIFKNSIGFLKNTTDQVN